MKKLLVAIIALLWASFSYAQFNGCRVGFCPGGIFGGGASPAAILPPSMQSNPPDFYANLKTNKAYVKGVSYNPPATNYINVSRASAATQVDSSGNWIQCLSSVLCRTDLGASIWEARTNSIRNNTMVGAVIGTPGTLPTNWQTGLVSVGLNTQVVGLGTESGIDYIDFRVFGTTTSPSTAAAVFQFDGGTIINATYGQTWSASSFVYVVNGSIASLVNIYQQITMRDAAGTFLGSAGQTTFNTLSGPLGTRRLSTFGTLTNTNTARVTSEIRINVGNGVAVDFTLRLGWPQLENNSQTPSSVASAVKAADGTGGVNGSAVYSVSGGICTAPTLNVTWSAGVMTVNSVASAGSCTTLPPSPATLTYVSGAATGWTGATVNLTPTDNSAKAAASNPILTTSAAASRVAEADNLILSGLPAFGNAMTIWGRMTPLVPSAYPINQYIVSLNDGTLNNRQSIFRNSATGGASYRYISSGVTGISTSSGLLNTSISSKMVLAGTNADQSGYANGANQVTGAGAGVPTVTNFYIGQGETGNTGYANGNMEEFAIWFNQRVPNAQLQSMTQ